MFHVTGDYAIMQIYSMYRSKYGRDPNFQIAAAIAEKYKCVWIPETELKRLLDSMLYEVESAERKLAGSAGAVNVAGTTVNASSQIVSGHVVLTPTQDGWVGGFTIEADSVTDARLDLSFETYYIKVAVVYWSGFEIKIARVEDGNIVELVFQNSYMRSGSDSRTLILKPKATYTIAFRGYAIVDAMKSAFDKLATIDFKITVTGVNVKVGETRVNVTDTGVTLTGGQVSSSSVSLTGVQTSGGDTGAVWDAFKAVGALVQYLPYLIMIFIVLEVVRAFRR